MLVITLSVSFMESSCFKLTLVSRLEISRYNLFMGKNTIFGLVLIWFSVEEGRGGG